MKDSNIVGSMSHESHDFTVDRHPDLHKVVTFSPFQPRNWPEEIVWTSGAVSSSISHDTLPFNQQTLSKVLQSCWEYAAEYHSWGWAARQKLVCNSLEATCADAITSIISSLLTVLDTFLSAACFK